MRKSTGKIRIISKHPGLLEVILIFPVDFSKGEAAGWGKDSALLRISPTVLTGWRFFISSLSNSPARKLPPGEKFRDASDFPNSPDWLEFFHIFAVEFPSAEATGWGKTQRCYRFPQQPDLLEFFISSQSNSPARKQPAGEKLRDASDSPNSADRLEFFHIFAVEFPSAEAAAWGKTQRCL
ncbi:MAG: hypothetical protein IJJ38_05785, partial [Lachnospiraceae bacterium]|nr:hypothetical protein [Lachnospiraceae bacterium]